MRKESLITLAPLNIRRIYVENRDEVFVKQQKFSWFILFTRLKVVILENSHLDVNLLESNEIQIMKEPTFFQSSEMIRHYKSGNFPIWLIFYTFTHIQTFLNLPAERVDNSKVISCYIANPLMMRERKIIDCAIDIRKK